MEIIRLAGETDAQALARRSGTERSRRIARAAKKQAPFLAARQKQGTKKSKYLKRAVKPKHPVFGYGRSSVQSVMAPPAVFRPARAAGVIPGGGPQTRGATTAGLRLILRTASGALHQLASAIQEMPLPKVKKE